MELQTSLKLVALIYITLSSFPHHANADADISSLNLLVVGDWGRKGLFNQSTVASQMDSIGQQLQISFVISTGDNFYENGLSGTDDPSFGESFSNIYTGSSLQTTWHAVLGNHDYKGDTLAQLDPALTTLDSRWHCYRTSILKYNLPLSCQASAGLQCPSVNFFLLDTTPFVDEYWGVAKKRYDWRGVLPRRAYLKKQLNDLNLALQASQAIWKIVVGHHPIRSIGSHHDTFELVKQLLPILEANQIDLYVNGHAHSLQHFTSNTSAIHFLTSGGGSQAWGVANRNQHMEGLQFFYAGQGFLSMQITPNFLHIVFYDIEGNSLHKLDLSKS
eukprot:Gb_19459 [translate_table: standard]